MALDAEDFDFQGLGDKLTQTILGSFNDATKKLNLSSVGTSLVDALKNVKMSKVIEDSLTKSSEVKATMKDIQKKLEDGFNKIKFKVGDIIIPDLPEQVVKVSYSYDKLQPPKLENVPVQLVPDTSKMESVKPSIDTGPMEKAGDLVKQFVTLTTEANKKTKITAELYTQIVGIAEKLVEAKRMERDAVNEIAASLQEKMETPVPAKPTGTAPTTSTKPTQQSTTQQVTLQPDTTAFETKLGEILTSFSKKLVTIFDRADLGNLDKSVKRTVSRFDPLSVSLEGDLTAELDGVLKDTTKLDRIQQNLIRNAEEDYRIAERRVDLTDTLYISNTRLSAEQYQARKEELIAAAKRLNIANAEKMGTVELAALVKSRLVDLYKERELKEDIVDATNAYNQAMRQSKEDLRTKGLIVQLNLTEDEVIQKARLLVLENERLGLGSDLTAQQIQELKLQNDRLRHEREHVELIEHVAQYQLKINEEVEELTMSWKKVGATIKAIYTNPTLAKGVIVASAIQGVHALTHSMHEFKEVGMGAGEAVSATFRSLSVASLLGLSKSADVTKTLAQEFGNLNTLTEDQIDSVGKMAANNGLAGEEATNLVMSMSRMPGMTRESAANSEKMFKEIGKAKGVIPAQIMKEMAKTLV